MIKDALGLEMRLPQEWSLTPPKVGDVWVVSSSGVDEGIVLISAVRDGYVLAWPVTSCNENAGYPALELSLANVGSLIAWPEAEFGLSSAGLDRSLGSAISPELANKVMRSLRTGTRVEGVKYLPVRIGAAADDALDAVCTEAWRLGELAEWQGAVADIALTRASRIHQGETASPEANPESDCPHDQNTWFDRTLCAGGNMHEVCSDCGRVIDDPGCVCQRGE